MRILIDMNLSPGWVQVLESAGIRATHWASVGRPDATDKQIMNVALSRGDVLLTNDLDFSAILAATSGRGPSVVQLRSQTLDPALLGERLVGALRQMESELAAGALLTIDLGRARVRLLPLLASRG